MRVLRAVVHYHYHGAPIPKMPVKLLILFTKPGASVKD
jgi:hypothetical protein